MINISSEMNHNLTIITKPIILCDNGIEIKLADNTIHINSNETLSIIKRAVEVLETLRFED
jgi:hypothetical protein